MKVAVALFVAVLVGCSFALSGCTSDEADSGGATNPPTLWLAMTSGSAMKLVGEEPHPY